MKNITEKYKDKIEGVLRCYDRLIISGTLPMLCHHQGMTNYLYKQGVRIFDYPKFAEPYKNLLRENAEQLARDNAVEIEFIRKAHIRKEEIIQKKLSERGTQPGLVHILSTMEVCPSYQPWHDKISGKTFLKGTQGKCLHYYFYFIDELLGLCYVRVPTWCPFRLQIYFNGHNFLASKIKNAGINFTMLDNAFDNISDWENAQKLSDEINISQLHKKFDEFADTYCPVYRSFKQHYHWSIMQCEYATDIVFKNQEDLQKIYEQLTLTAIHTVKPENIATFLGKKLDGRFQGEVGNNYNVRIEGTRVKHNYERASIKMYDKHQKILRIETSTNDISFFKHYREVVQRDGTIVHKNAQLKKGIYSLEMLSDLLQASNGRYLEFISAFDTNEVARKRLVQVTNSVKQNDRNYKGFNFFHSNDLKVLMSILKGEFNINGLRNKHLQSLLQFTSSQISRLLKRLRVHGLIKKVCDSHKYYVTKLGKETIVAAEKIKELMLVPIYSY